LGVELARAGWANFFWDDRLLARGGLDHLGISCRIVALNLSAKRRLCNTVGVPLRLRRRLTDDMLELLGDIAILIIEAFWVGHASLVVQQVLQEDMQRRISP
jgi:hypothetical protein